MFTAVTNGLFTGIVFSTGAGTNLVAVRVRAAAIVEIRQQDQW